MAPVGVKVTALPLQILKLPIETVGKGLTVINCAMVFEHPAALVPVMV